MGEDAATVDVDLITNCDIVAENCHVLEASPSANGAVPADDGGLHPGVVLDLGATEQHTSLQADTVTDNDIRTDRDIGSDPAVLANLGRGVDHDISAVNVGLSGRSELLAALLCEGREVQACTAEEVLGLSNVHPEAFEVERMKLVVLDHSGEGLLLDRSRAELDTVEDGSVEDVHAGVDTVADELDGLLDKSVDQRAVTGLVDNNTILGGFLNLGDDNGTLIAVVLVESQEVLEGVVADDIGVEDEEGRVVLSENTLSKLQGSSGIEGLSLDGEFDVDVVLLLVLSQELLHDLRSVVDSKDDISDTRCDQRLNLVHNHGLVGELDKRLGESEGERAKASTKAADKNKSLHDCGIEKLLRG